MQTKRYEEIKLQTLKQYLWDITWKFELPHHTKQTNKRIYKS